MEIFQKAALEILKYIPQTDPLRILNQVAMSKFTEMKVTLEMNSVPFDCGWLRSQYTEDIEG